mmetsp:Transcript_30955/g.99001  ORF Transcript_30955/g.99001 Transcript_30955/m.99001 type:complete len:92 (-) Transcript_30955:974-1249(-)
MITKDMGLMIARKRYYWLLDDYCPGATLPPSSTVEVDRDREKRRWFLCDDLLASTSEAAGMWPRPDARPVAPDQLCQDCRTSCSTCRRQLS